LFGNQLLPALNKKYATKPQVHPLMLLCHGTSSGAQWCECRHLDWTASNHDLPIVICNAWAATSVLPLVNSHSGCWQFWSERLWFIFDSESSDVLSTSDPIL